MNFIPHTDADIQHMMQTIGLGDLEELFEDIPQSIRLKRPLNLSSGRSEPELWQHVQNLAEMNTGAEMVCFAGAGAYDHFVPPVVKQLASRGEFVTSYTPYQPEISQGTLQVIFEYQSLICQLLEMDLANASLYDGSTALAEACIIALRETGSKQISVAGTLHPEYAQVLETYARAWGVRINHLPHENGRTLSDVWQSDRYECGAALIVQQPNFFGQIEEMHQLSRWAHQQEALFVAVVDPLTLGILPSPGSYDADLAVGEGQPLGQPLQYGGPYLGFMAAKQNYLRQLPGRIVGQTTDLSGRRGFVLTLQAREQHIRRERASSNICTNQAHNALMATIYLSWLGPAGLREIGELCLEKSRYLADRIGELPGYRILYPDRFIKEFVVQTPVPAREILQQAMQHGMIAGVDLGRFRAEWQDLLLVAVTEMRTRQEMDALVSILGERS